MPGVAPDRMHPGRPRQGIEPSFEQRGTVLRYCRDVQCVQPRTQIDDFCSLLGALAQQLGDAFIFGGELVQQLGDLRATVDDTPGIGFLFTRAIVSTIFESGSQDMGHE